MARAVWRQFLLATTCFVAAGQVGYAASAVLPSGFSVAAGAGSVSTPNPTTKVIQQTTDKAAFNWSSFSISNGAGVVFRQPGGGSIALNRVTGPGASQIDGRLTANGQVWLVNPNGVFFGAGSQVNVGGLLATTADIRNQDFLAGNYSFSGATGAAIVNQGEIRAASGGSVVLAGAQVANSGLIRADLGTVQLAAGKSFALDLTGDKLISFQVTAVVDQPSAQGGALISNTGTLRAAGGRVLLTARAAKTIVDNVINTTGIVEARTASLVNGEIVLDGGDAGTVQVAGRLDASGPGVGGNVSVLGNNINVAGVTASSLKASGQSISLAAVRTTGVQSYNGPTTLVPGATLTSSGGAVLFNSSVTLGALGTAKTLVTIDTTNKGAVPAGAGIRFAGTLGAAALGLNDLKLTAGTSGNVIFNHAVSGIGALTVASAHNVQINAADGAAPTFSVRSLAITAGGSVNAIGSISTNGQADSHGGPQNAGNITIAARGDVSLGSAGSLFPGVSARGGDATVAGAVAGNGGTLAITGATIELPAAFDTRGGNAALAGFPPTLSTSNGGNGGAVTLHATGGPVSIGNPVSATFATSAGGGANSVAGRRGGDGGAISISGTGITLTSSLDASGGSSDLGALASGGNGGAITLTATAGDIAGSSGNLSFLSIQSQGGQAGGMTNMQGGGTGNAAGGRGGAISLSATGSIDLPNTFGGSAGGFAAGLGFGGAAGPITLHTQSGDVTWSDLFAFGGGSFFGKDGAGGPVTINSGGAVSLSGEIDTRFFGAAGIVSHAGAVTVNARGAVAIGTGIFGINLPAISSFNAGSGTDGAINITGASVLLPTGAVADLGGTHQATGGTITLTATDPVNGSVTSGALTGSAIRIAAQQQVSLTDVTANAGNVAIATAGGVNAVGSISANGQSDGSAGRQNAGNITVAARGDVSLGSAASPSPSVSAQGGDATTIDSIAGNGGAIRITGATIALPAGFSTRGGDAIPASGGFPPPLSNSDGGNGGSVTLHATAGPVTIGDPALVAVATSRGGNTQSAPGHASGAGGAISISGTSVILDTSSLDASGGSAGLRDAASGGKGGAITLSATAGNITTTNGFNGSIVSAGGEAGGIDSGAGGDGGAIRLGATSAIDLPNTTFSTAGGFAHGDGAGGSAGTITLRTRSGDVIGNNVFAFGGGSLVGSSGSGAPVAIGSGGAVSFGGHIFTNSGFGLGPPLASAATVNAGGNLTISGLSGLGSLHAGAVTINAQGDVAIGTAAGTSGPAIVSVNFGTGADGPISISGARIVLPTGAATTLDAGTGTTGGTIVLTATDPANGTMTAGPLTASAAHITASSQVSLSGVTANAGSITVDGGSIALNGPLSTVSGNIFASAIGPIQLSAPVTATGGNVIVTSLGGTGITVTNTTIRARNTAADLSTNGTVSITGAVTLTGSSATAGTGRVVSLQGP